MTTGAQTLPVRQFLAGKAESRPPRRDAPLASARAPKQKQALSASLFLYRHVIGREVGDLGEVIRARTPKRLPVVMTRDEVKADLSKLTGDKWLMVSLMYGAGLRPVADRPGSQIPQGSEGLGSFRLIPFWNLLISIFGIAGHDSSVCFVASWQVQNLSHGPW
jgi:hypothetical protein